MKLIKENQNNQMKLRTLKYFPQQHETAYLPILISRFHFLLDHCEVRSFSRFLFPTKLHDIHHVFLLFTNFTRKFGAVPFRALSRLDFRDDLYRKCKRIGYELGCISQITKTLGSTSMFSPRQSECICHLRLHLKLKNIARHTMHILTFVPWPYSK